MISLVEHKGLDSNEYGSYRSTIPSKRIGKFKLKTKKWRDFKMEETVEHELVLCEDSDYFNSMKHIEPMMAETFKNSMCIADITIQGLEFTPSFSSSEQETSQFFNFSKT